MSIPARSFLACRASDCFPFALIVAAAKQPVCGIFSRLLVLAVVLCVHALRAVGSTQGSSVITFCGFCLLGLVGEPGCLGNPCRLLFWCCVSQGVPGLEVGGFSSRACSRAALWQLVCHEGGAACVLGRSSALIGWNGTKCCLFAR